MAVPAVTGPSPFQREPTRPESHPLRELLGRARSPAELGVARATKQLRRPEQRLAYVAALLWSVPTGRHLLERIEREDVFLGRLRETDKSYGYYLAGDRVVYLRTKELAGSARILSHEARHVAHHALGFSTIIEFYERGTRLPFDGRSYLLLNRSIEADADAHACQVARELLEAGHESVWQALSESREFGKLARAYSRVADDDPDAVADGRAMAAAYDEWFRIGRAYGYDTYLLDWLERLTEKHGEIRAQRALGHDDFALLGARPDGTNYLLGHPAPGGPRVLHRGAYAVLADDVRERLEALTIAARPARVLSMPGAVRGDDDLSWVATPQTVHAEIDATLGEVSEAPPRVIQIISAHRTRAGGLNVMSLSAEAPRSARARFLRNVMRARVDAILTTGRVLRRRPELMLTLQGAGELAAGLWRFRRERVGRLERARVVVLTASGDVDPKHPSLVRAARPLILTGAVGAKRLQTRGIPKHITIVERPEPSLRDAVAYLHEAGIESIAVEAGPAAALDLYEPPLLVDELVLSIFESADVPEGVVTGPFAAEPQLTELFGAPRLVTRSTEASGEWTFRRYVR